MRIELLLVGVVFVILGIEAVGVNNKRTHWLVDRIGYTGYRLLWMILGLVIIVLSYVI